MLVLGILVARSCRLGVGTGLIIQALDVGDQHADLPPQVGQLACLHMPCKAQADMWWCCTGLAAGCLWSTMLVQAVRRSYGWAGF